MNAGNLLMVADSVHDANMLYAAGMFVPDPFIYLRLKGRPCVVLNDTEIDRGRREVKNCKVLSLSCRVRRLHRQGVGSPDLAQVVGSLAREAGVKKLLVPYDFPLGLARALRRLKVRVKVKSGSFFPERELKSEAEVSKISAALVMAEVGMAEAVHALRNSRINSAGKLVYRNALLTSERLRAIIDTAVIQAGGSTLRTIVAGGARTCDPHDIGQGVLRARQPIIIDVFPRSQRTGYYGDITRTVVKGRPSDALCQLYRTVVEAQQLAFSRLEHATPAAEVHLAVENFFTGRGYRTGRVKGRMQGFFHSTGHGLGLQMHELPRLNASSESVLRAGHVVTVEPGLYYPGLGGVRLEDVALVTRNGARNLTRFEKTLEV